ncbi:hypothetical protein GLYMA_10G292600v4 [Glycine max]|uniref:Uncharacterized protein n=1 Tax=Glycine max TaxID=3847 RepID=K7LM36_SOYBN|nr:hypothetical protein GYH30_029507 [Glycine max]KRH36244.1 hypothetical protein GLYMA_10G292600v4 [Glycine max]
MGMVITDLENYHIKVNSSVPSCQRKMIAIMYVKIIYDYEELLHKGSRQEIITDKYEISYNEWL